jgi:uncharacterized protein
MEIDPDGRKGKFKMIENTTALYDKSIICRHCETPFSTKRIRGGSLSMKQRDADFCTYFKEQSLNPIFYSVNVCPQCGFSFSDQFNAKLTPAQAKIVQEKISSKWTMKDFGAIRSKEEAIACYKLGIYTSEITDQPHSVKAGLYLRLAWIYRFTENEVGELSLIKMAVEEYEQSYIHSDYMRGDKEMSEVRLLYLIGELHRRLGNFDSAIRYFGKALEFRNRTLESGIIRMAQDQWQLAREEYKNRRSEQETEQEIG